MRVLVYSQVQLFGEAILVCLRERAGLTGVHFCRQAELLSREIIKLGIDVVLFDVKGETALGEARALKWACPLTPLVALAVPNTPEHVIACADAGFSGYVSTEASLDELYLGMTRIYKGEYVCDCSTEIAGRLFREVGTRQRRVNPSAPGEALTRREGEIFELLAQGLANKKIAFELSISVATVKNHLHSLFMKLHVGCRAEAIARLRNTPWLISSTDNTSPPTVLSRRPA